MAEIKMVKKYCRVCKDETSHRGPLMVYFYQCTRCEIISLPFAELTPQEVEELSWVGKRILFGIREPKAKIGA